MKLLLLLGGALALPAATPTATPTPTPESAVPVVSLLQPDSTATPTPEPAATPPPDELPARLALGRVRVVGKALQLAVSARGGSLSDVRIALRRGERPLRAITIASLSGTRKLVLKPRGGLTRGSYTVHITVEGVVAADRAVTVR